MGYPMLANWIRFKRIGENEFIVKDLLQNEQMKTDAYTVWFARQLNGKRNPYKIDQRLSRKDVDLLLDELEVENIIRDKRFLSKFFLYLLITVWRPRVTSNLRLISFLINGMLLISWLPLLGFSIYFFIHHSYDLSTDYIIIGSLTGLFIGLVMHELGHMFACLGYGGRVFEVGVMLRFLLPGAYVLMNASSIKKRMRRIQVNAAGIEMNLLLTGILLILSTRLEALSGFFLGAAIQNTFLALLNLTLIDEFDGIRIMSELLGVDEIVERATQVTKNGSYKKKLKNEGPSGKATIAVCYVFRAIQIALPILLAINIMGVISWFL